MEDVKDYSLYVCQEAVLMTADRYGYKEIDAAVLERLTMEVLDRMCAFFLSHTRFQDVFMYSEDG